MTHIFRLILLVLVVHLVPAGCAAPPDAPGRSTDFELIELVLVDLIDFKEFHSLTGRDGKKSQIVLSDQTIGSSGFLSDDQLSSESYPEKDKLVPPDIGADLRRRNPKEPISLSAFNPKNPNIIVEDLSDIDGKDDAAFEKKHPDARGYVEAWMPGYSEDGRTAVVRVLFGPTPHAATATYMLVKQDGRWKVKWRKTAYYV